VNRISAIEERSESKVLPAQREAFAAWQRHAQDPSAPEASRQLAKTLGQPPHPRVMPLFFSGVKVLRSYTAQLAVVTGDAEVNLLAEIGPQSFWVNFWVPADDSGTPFTSFFDFVDGSAILYPTATNVLAPPPSESRLGYDLGPFTVYNLSPYGWVVAGPCTLSGVGTLVARLGFQVNLGPV
jgi:hypothetical protein